MENYLLAIQCTYTIWYIIYYCIPTFYFQNQYNYLIGGLIIWKNYEIQVAAYNVKGVGVYSRSIQIKTKEGLPAAPPKEVEAEAISSTSIKVSWKPPEPWMINGINQGYKLQAWQGKCHGNLEMMSSLVLSFPFL